MEIFAKIVNDFQPLIVFAKSSILDVWQASEYASRNMAGNLIANGILHKINFQVSKDL